MKPAHEVWVQQTHEKECKTPLLTGQVPAALWEERRQLLAYVQKRAISLILWTEFSVFRHTSRTQNTPINHLVYTMDFVKFLKTKFLAPLLLYICINRENIRNLTNTLEKNIKQYAKRKKVTYLPEQRCTITLWKIGSNDEVYHCRTEWWSLFLTQHFLSENNSQSICLLHFIIFWELVTLNEWWRTFK